MQGAGMLSLWDRNKVVSTPESGDWLRISVFLRAGQSLCQPLISRVLCGSVESQKTLDSLKTRNFLRKTGFHFFASRSGLRLARAFPEFQNDARPLSGRIHSRQRAAESDGVVRPPRLAGPERGADF